MLAHAASAAQPDVGRPDNQLSPIRLELNRLEPQGAACRAYLLIDNSRGDAMRSLKLDLFVLNQVGVVAKRLAVETGPFSAHKTLIKVFDFADLACPTVGQVLLNDVLSCEGPSGPRTDCVERLETTSKAAPVAFAK